MVDQAQPKSLGSDHPDASFVEGNAGGESRFPPRGRPVIRGINRIGLWSLYMKEVRRFLKVQTQTIWAPAVTTVLFLVIFSVALGRGGREVLGVNFPTFVAPGLIAMAMMQNAFANSSFSLLSGKIQGTIIDLLMPPLSEGELMCGIVGAAMTRAVAVGFVVAGAMMLYPGVSLAMAHPWAEKFDHNAAVTNFVVAPLAMLSGTFYVIDRLAPAFQAVSRANPFFYVISGFRYGFLGRSDIGDAAAVTMAALGLFALNAVLAFATYRILKSGWKIKN